MKKLISLFIILFTATIAYSQHSQTLYYMDRLPQITTMNPSSQPECNFYLFFPGVAGTSLNVGNNTLNYNDIIFENQELDSLVTFLHPTSNINDFLNKLEPQNDIFADISATIFGMGFRAGEGYFSFNVMHKSELRMSYPKDLATMALKGNEAFLGETANLGDFSLFSNNYLEFSLGYSRKIYDNLTVGLKAKYLSGLAFLESKDFNAGLYTSSNGDSLSLTTDILLQGTAPVTISTDSSGFIDNVEEPETLGVNDAFQNPGFAIDIGGTYKLNDQFSFSAAIVDLGFINYKNYVHNYTVNGQFSFTGVDVSNQIGNESNSDPMEELADSLQESVKMEYSQENFLQFLGPKIFLGGRYFVGERLDFGFLSRTRFHAGDVHQSFTLSANTRPIRAVSLSLSYSVMNGAYNNIGAGVALRLLPFQFYVMTDNISMGMWPGKTRSFNVRFGMNFVLGCNKAKRIRNDTPMIR